MIASEIQKIKEAFVKVIEFSQDLNDITIDSLFDEWLEAKRDIIEAFDGKLIYEVPEKISFHLDDTIRKVNFSNFVDNISNVFQNERLVDFLSANEEGFYANTVPTTYQNEDIKVPKGMKLVKAFKYFEKDQHLLTELQNQASQIIQEDKIEGKLCFSVHPLDYLSASLNTYNWRSCHALDGDYRSGNLSYMVDKSTIVCYLKGDHEDTILPLFPNDVLWNSKKWRVLLFLSDRWNMIFAGRQYPFSSKSGLDIVRQHLLPALKNVRMSDWKNDYVSEYTDNNAGEVYKLAENYLPYCGELYKISSIIKDQNHLHFNDLLNSSCYLTPYYMIKHEYWYFDGSEALPQVNIGGNVKCLRCGKKHIVNADVMICPDCIDDINYDPDEQVFCDCCGRVIRNGDWQEVQGETICDQCVENECFVCDKCGEIHFNTHKKYDRKYDEYICIWCYAALKEEDE